MDTLVIDPPGLRLSRVGLGCVTFGREIDESAAHALLDRAVARGITLLDTAAAYGDGASERVLGGWLAARRAGAGVVTIATKVAPPYDPARIAPAVCASLDRLGLATLDLLYLHRWDPTAARVETLAALDACVREGRARALGVSNCTAAQLAAALDLQTREGLEPFRVIQNNHNLAVRDVDADLRRLCAGRGIAIVTYSPLGAGCLTGKHRRGVQPGSRFELVPGHQDVYFNERARRRLARLEAVAARTGHGQVHIALAWALHQPGIASVLVGVRTHAHIDQALDALALDDRTLFEELDTDAESDVP